MAKKDSGNEQDTLGRALKALLRPVIRFCIRRSIKLQQFMEIVKAVFVEVGEEELRSAKGSESVSRLSVMTGVHRKDVSRLLTEGMKEQPASDIFTRVVGQWKNDSRFTTRSGMPRALELGGGAGEFAKLVRSVSKEVNPYTVLFELERLEMVRREGDVLQLRVNEYAPQKDAEAGFQLISADIDDLLSSAEANIFHNREIPNLHLTTRYDNICREFLPQIQRWCMNEGAKMHKKARNYLAKFDKDLNPRLKTRAGGCKVSFGSFGYSKLPDFDREDKE